MSGILNAIGLGGNKDNTSTNSHSNSTMSSNNMNSTNSNLGSTTTSGRPIGSTTTTTTAYDSGNTGTGYRTNTSGAYDQTNSNTNLSGDDAMTRSEERLHVGKESVEAGKARLHKYVTSEHVEKEVPLQKESVVLEREPINESNRDKAYSGPEIKEAEYEVNLREERPVVSKDTVAKERVRLAKNVEQESETVGGDVRKEHIEYGATPGVDINKTTSGTRTGTTTGVTGNTTTARNDMNLQGVKSTNPTYTA